MARSSINQDSLEYLKVPVTAPVGVTIDTQVVEIAVMAPASQPEEADWRNAEWSDGNVARILIGPGEKVLTPGSYMVWVRITDTPEIPVLTAGTITVT